MITLIKSNQIVPSSGNWTVWSSTPNIGMPGGQGMFEIMPQRHASRLQWGGPDTGPNSTVAIEKVEFHTGTLTGYTAIYLKIYRWTGTTYSLVGTSSNLIGLCAPNTRNLITLPSPITGCQEGDYPALRVVGESGSGSILCQLTDTNNVTTWFVQDTTDNPAVPTNPINWETQTPITNNYVQIRLYATAPHFCVGGDSQLEGQFGHRSFHHDGLVANDHTDTDMANTPAKHIANISGLTYHNICIGGEVSNQTVTRFPTDGALRLAKLYFFHTFWNNIRGGDTNLANAQADLASLMLQVQALGAFMELVEPVPLTGQASGDHQVMDLWIPALRAQIGAGPLTNHWAPLRYAVGQFRGGGDPLNLWDWIPAYVSGDTLHPSNAGKAAVASALWSAWAGRSLISGGAGRGASGRAQLHQLVDMHGSDVFSG